MGKPAFDLNPEQMEALRQFQSERQATRARGPLMNPAAIEANRMGQLTAEQRKYLISRVSGFGILGLVLWFVMLGAIVAATGRTLANNPVIGFVVLFGTLIVAVVVVGWITSLPMRMRLANPHIEQATGEVVWHKSHYTPEANDKWLQTVVSQTLVPGLYTFYLLAGTPYVISAEMTGTHGDATAPAASSQTVDRAELSRALGLTNGFTADDLEANRAGRLSGRQVRWMLRDVLNNLYGIVLLLVIVALIVGAVMTKAKVDPAGLLAIAAILGLAFILLFIQVWGDVRDIFGGRVVSVEGPATRRIRSEHRGRAHHYYVVDGYSFEVSSAAYDALLEGVRYRVYYVPYTGGLMSIEPLA